MEGVLDIPKIYTANAEWLAAVVAILIYRKYIDKKWTNLLLIGGGLAVSYVLIRLCQMFCERYSNFLWLFGMAGAVLIMIATINLALRVKWSAAFYIGARTFMWAEFAASLEWQIFHYYTFGRGIVRSALYAMIFCLISYIVVYTVYFAAEGREVPKDADPAKLNVTRSQLWFAWLFTILLFTLSNLSYVLGDTPFTSSDIKDIFYIRTLSDAVGVIVGQAFHLLVRDTERTQENAAFQTVLRNQYIQFRESKDNIDMINRKYHDLKHQLQILRETTNEAERSAYIDEIQEGIEKYEAENKTGNDVLDTVLTSKQSRCLKEHITMTVVADGTLLSRMTVMDICTVFGNALDNAIEHEIKIENPEKRLIHLTISEKNGFVCILVENYYEGETIADGALPETTKKNKQYHGFGLRSVKYTVEKYGGYINTGVRDGWFRLEIIYPKE